MPKNSYVTDFALCDILHDKEALARQYAVTMFNRTQEMFSYTGLPETIPAYFLEMLLQRNGSVTIARVKGGAYDGQIIAFDAGIGDVPNIYLFPTKSIIANPYYSADLVIDKDCVLMKNDSYMLGLLPMFSKYAYELAETDISLKWALVNSRVLSVFKADSDNVAETAKKYLQDVEEGKKLGIVVASSFGDNAFTTLPNGTSSANYIKDILEAQQFISAKWFNDLGLQANYNMKREAINSAETGMNEETFYPSVENMLKCRKEAIEKVNVMFGLNISVELSSSWARKEEYENKRITDVAE